MNTLSSVLEQRRRELGLTLAQIADKMDVSEATVQRWESGNIKSLRQGKIAKLAEVLGVQPSALMGWSEVKTELLPDNGLTVEARHIAYAFDRADEKSKGIARVALAEFIQKEDPEPAQEDRVDVKGGIKHRADGMDELIVYVDQLPAAGYGTYFDEPTTRMEQYPRGIIPRGASFGVVVSGNSMEPEIKNHATAFVRSQPRVENGEIGLFSLNGASYVKKLVIDEDNRKLLLRSLNPVYDDIVVSEDDYLYTFGKVLGSYPV